MSLTALLQHQRPEAIQQQATAQRDNSWSTLCHPSKTRKKALFLGVGPAGVQRPNEQVNELAALFDEPARRRLQAATRKAAGGGSRRGRGVRSLRFNPFQQARRRRRPNVELAVQYAVSKTCAAACASRPANRRGGGGALVLMLTIECPIGNTLQQQQPVAPAPPAGEVVEAHQC